MASCPALGRCAIDALGDEVNGGQDARPSGRDVREPSADKMSALQEGVKPESSAKLNAFLIHPRQMAAAAAC